MIKFKKQYSLSEQQLVDCVFVAGTDGCDGGWPENSLGYIKSLGGLASDTDYPYFSGSTGNDGTCKAASMKRKYAPIKDYKKYSRSDSSLSELKANITVQPIAAKIRAESQTWDFYKKGILTCDNTNGCSSINHNVLIIGYTPTYWIIRNSWSKDWGMNGDAFINIDTTDEKDCWIAQDFYTVELY